ncbi:MAG: hypothetical protein CM15mP65_13960 [Crocinitomicaceae bacterium]|nr:MAG: hypothetical protein CM15mP65_13960 [Crocinitomicaceae bacterium]
MCYKATCYATTAHLSKMLNLSEDKFTTTFQSRLGRDPWLEPYTDQTVEHLAKKGVKKMLVFSPAFVADCLETILEISEENQEIFLENGGERLDLVPHLMIVKTGLNVSLK